MAIAFPLPLATFADALRIASATFELNEPVMSAKSASGVVFTAANGSAMWRGRIVTTPTRGADGKRVEALMDMLRGAGRSFLMRDRSYIGPQNDPQGSILSGRRLALAAIETSRLRIGPISGAPILQGFPPELRLLPGDMIGFQYGSNPVRYALHRVAPGAASYGHSGGGVSAWIDIVPALRPGVTVGAAVRLVKPVCKAVPVPGTISGGEAEPGQLRGGWTLEWVQTLR